MTCKGIVNIDTYLTYYYPRKNPEDLDDKYFYREHYFDFNYENITETFLRYIKNYISNNSNYSCYGSIALKLLDENICSLIPIIFNRNNCYNKIAIEKKDKNICDKIIKDEKATINIITRDECYNEIK